MDLTHHQTGQGSRWAVDGHYLPPQLNLTTLLGLPQKAMLKLLGTLTIGDKAEDTLIAPIDAQQEVWASGVTYLRSREARKAESTVADVYEKVYDAIRPELFFKASGWRVAGPDSAIRIRKDSKWNVPEPELVLVINSSGEIVGYTIGNDVSSRSIEGENPLYLPQAKVYNGSCALGPAIKINENTNLRELDINIKINRQNEMVFDGKTSTSQIKRSLEELVKYLGAEMDFPYGCLLMTGTGIVPPDSFTLMIGDIVEIAIGELTLRNTVAA